MDKDDYRKTITIPTGGQSQIKTFVFLGKESIR
jgi:hypothetical protein